MKFLILSMIFFSITALGVEQSTFLPKVKIALLSSPSVVGKYSQSSYNVAMATLLASAKPFELVAYKMPNESYESISTAVKQIINDGNNAILAPLTLEAVKNLLTIKTSIPIFIPTVHRRDIGFAPDNIIFGSIDYEAQIKALVPHMENSIAIFYDDSLVGLALSKATQQGASESNKQITNFSTYGVDIKGANIVKYLAKPSQFNKKSVITHLPVVKTSMLLSQMTFTGVRENNILSTQINYDPTLITLTQYPDRKNMIIANSIVEQVPAIYGANSLMNNDLSFDWINYTTSVGTDYLIANLFGVERVYSMPMINHQIVYPVELMRPKESGFEPFKNKQ